MKKIDLSDALKAGATVLAATPRLARHLRWRYDRERFRQGGRAWRTPAVLTLADWLERCWEHSLIGGGQAAQAHLLNHAQFLRAVDLAADRTDAREIPAAGPFARRLLGRGWILMREWDIAPADLRAASVSPDSRDFAAWTERYAELCRERGWVDHASLPGRLLPELLDGSIPLPASCVLAGFERPTANQRRLFSVLEANGRLAGALAEGPGDFLGAARRLAAPEPSEERHLAACWARQRLEAQPDAAVGVIVPDLRRHAPEFRRSFLDAFDPAWRDRDGTLFPVGLDDGTTLADTGLVHTALLLLRAPGGRLDFREIGQLLRSPYLRGGISEATERARLDLCIRDGRMQVVDLRALCNREFTDAPRQFLDLLGRLLDLGEQTRRRRAPAAWVPFIESLFRDAGLGLGRVPGHDEERVRDAWMVLLERFATLGEVVGEISFDAARRLLAEAAGERPLHSATRADGVQILSPWEADGHRFDAVWICGMTSEAWPPVARPFALIPASLQRDRGIPEAQPELYRAQAQAVMDRLLGCAPHAVLSWASRSGEEERVAAPLMASLPAVEAESLGLDPDRLDHRRALLDGPRPCSAADPPPALAASEQIRGGARLINMQSACPARAFFEFRLGAKELNIPPYGLDAAARGKILHDCAEHLYRSLGPAGGSANTGPAELDEKIADAVELALERHIPRRHPLTDTLHANERRRLGRLLHMLVERDRERGKFTVAELEGCHAIDVGGLSLQLRFDRVDALPGGARLVIDYKTGAYFSMRQCLGERPLELQLPLYAVYGAADGIAHYWLHADRVRIDAIARDDFGILSGRKRANLLDADTWAAQIERWRVILEGLVGEIVAGDCRIDLEHDRWAGGQFAMLTRRWDVDDAVNPVVNS
ncbi:MAG: PD-(D/E)XK nuclease family protein [Gammaproteobacteria bacterium]